MARFFVWSDAGDSVFLARRLASEGHAVDVYIHDPASRRLGDGLVRKAAAPQPGAVVLFDGVGHGALGQRYRAAGHPVIGGNPLDRALELDRTQGTALMGAVGIATPETRTFRDRAAADAFLAEEDGGTWFFKPSGNQGTATTMGGPPAMLRRFLAWALPQLPPGTPFELQRKVDGHEISCQGWFDGARFVPPFDSTLEDKRLMPGDIGPRAGCQANLVWPWWQNTALPTRTVARLADRLRAARYCGPIDCNMIVDDAGVPHGLEWTARFGFDATQAWQCLVRGDLGAQLEAFARGRLDRFDVDDTCAMTLRVSTPPYPDEGPAAERRGLPVDEDLIAHPRMFADDVMLDRAGHPVCAGRDGSLGVVAAVGDDVGELRRRCLALAAGLALPGLQYRNDPVARVERVWAALQDFGCGREGGEADGRALAMGD
jgi:phosphoribosylamine--glycine ligase